MPRSSLRPSARLRNVAALVVLSALTLGAPVAALRAQSSNTPIEQIRIVGTPKLYVQVPSDPKTYNSVWIVFRTSPHLHVSRQVVVRVKGKSGRAYGASGHPNCIRSTVIQAAKLLKPGAKYKVEFYARKSAYGSATKLLTSRTLAAHRWNSHAGSSGIRTPHC